MVKEIPLTQGKIALVDDEDYERIMKYKWHAHHGGNNWYALHSIDHYSKIWLHRFIMNAKLGERIDHIDGDGLNCCKYNLRIASHSQNMMNKRQYKNSRSHYKGVCWHKGHMKWEANININKKRIYLGSFIIEEDAAHIYDEAAKKYFGEFARLNLYDDSL